jgi:hypothetical protein
MLVLERRAIYFCRLEMNEDMMVLMDRVGIRMGRLASALKVLAAHETAVDVLIGHGHRANFLKVKIERRAVHLWS